MTMIAGLGYVTEHDGVYVVHTLASKSMFDDICPGEFEKYAEVAAKHDCETCQAVEIPELFAEVGARTAEQYAENVLDGAALTLIQRCVKVVDVPPIGEAIDFLSVYKADETVRPRAATLH